jgi:hypothetical protein
MDKAIMLPSLSFDRRQFLRLAGMASASLPVTSHAWGAAETTPASYESWKPGMLDIHHISTGRGNATFFLCPDGTTMLVDAGATAQSSEYIIAPKPDGSRRPGEWVARYAQRRLQEANRNEIDYCVLTHFHGDHMGDVSSDLPKSRKGNYQLTGIADVAEVIPVHRFLDRNYPDYNYPKPVDDEHSVNYIHMVKEHVRRGAEAHRFAVGSDKQIRLLRNAAAYPTFTVRNLAANGEVWTGIGDTTRHMFPLVSSLVPNDLPTENMCSLAFRLSYGAFDYYTGGDLSNGNTDGSEPWRDIETPVAQAAGPVDVAVVNHHGYADADGIGMVRALRPQAFLVLAWDSAHPTVNTLGNLLSTQLYPSRRDLFSTAMKEENRISNRRIADFKSTNGHIVVRVEPGGERFQILILDNANENDRVLARFGPYTSA